MNFFISDEYLGYNYKQPLKYEHTEKYKTYKKFNYYNSINNISLSILNRSTNFNILENTLSTKSNLDERDEIGNFKHINGSMKRHITN